MSDLDDEELRATRKLNGVEWEEDKQIQVGDYVRTKNGYIAKVIEIRDRFIWFDNCVYKNSGIPNYGINKETQFHIITKYNHNLIDLIECGDYVNGMLVQKIAEPSLVNDYKKLIYCNECKGSYEGIFNNNEIKTIVTHEQFNSVMYKVKE